MNAEPSPRPVGLVRLMGLLALFLVPGAACAAYLWHVLSELLSGRVPGGGVLLSAAGVLALLVALLLGLSYSLRRYGPGPA